VIQTILASEDIRNVETIGTDDCCRIYKGKISIPGLSTEVMITSIRGDSEGNDDWNELRFDLVVYC